MHMTVKPTSISSSHGAVNVDILVNSHSEDSVIMQVPVPSLKVWLWGLDVVNDKSLFYAIVRSPRHKKGLYHVSRHDLGDRHHLCRSSRT